MENPGEIPADGRDSSPLLFYLPYNETRSKS